MRIYLQDQELISCSSDSYKEVDENLFVGLGAYLLFTSSTRRNGNYYGSHYGDETDAYSDYRGQSGYHHVNQTCISINKGSLLLMLGTFPKTFPKRHLPNGIYLCGNFPKAQFPSRQLPKSVLAAVLAQPPSPSQPQHSAPHCSLQYTRRSNRTFEKLPLMGNCTFGKFPLGKLSLGKSRIGKMSFRKNT